MKFDQLQCLIVLMSHKWVLSTDGLPVFAIGELAVGVIRKQYIPQRDWGRKTPYALGSCCTGASPLQPAHASSPTRLHFHTALRQQALLSALDLHSPDLSVIIENI